MQNGTTGEPPGQAMPEQVMSAQAMSPHALDGVRVVELGTLIAGPFAGRIMADFGATVIKVENPSRPDPMRTWGRVHGTRRSLWWAVQ